MRIVGIIPARMASTRFPGKPLAMIHGRTMIEHIFRRSSLNSKFSDVCIATCDESIAAAAQLFGCRAIMTASSHQRGTDRVAEAAGQVRADLIVNIQGDEPLIRPEVFDELLSPFETNPGMSCSNLMSRIDSQAELENLNNVKVVTDRHGDALYFSREPIPSHRMGTPLAAPFRQIGIYAFSQELLLEFQRLAPTPLEIAESCDMLRLLEHGRRIRMVETKTVLQSVDTDADLRKAEELLTNDDLRHRY